MPLYMLIFHVNYEKAYNIKVYNKWPAFLLNVTKDINKHMLKNIISFTFSCDSPGQIFVVD